MRGDHAPRFTRPLFSLFGFKCELARASKFGKFPRGMFPRVAGDPTERFQIHVAQIVLAVNGSKQSAGAPGNT